jgi:hypothetical protein
MVRLSVKPRAQTFDDRTGSEVFTLPQAQVTENEKHDYYDANDVEDIIHSDFSPSLRIDATLISYGSRRQCNSSVKTHVQWEQVRCHIWLKWAI